MQSSAQQKRLARNVPGPCARLFVRVIAGVVVVSGMALACNLNSQQQDRDAPNRPTINPLTNRVPDANDQMAMREQQPRQTGPDAANDDRKRQIADDSAKLLKLAGDLKAEVDKTSKDTLSIGVIRKADQIEKLARSVKEKMKLTMGGN